MKFPNPYLRLLWLALIAAAVFVTGSVSAQVQSYPTRPVRLIVGFPPGGGTDMLARSLGNELSKVLGQPFVVYNRGGANGVIGTGELVKATPDGYTLMMTISSHVTNTLLQSTLPYRLADFQPVSVVATSPFVLIAHPDFAPNTVGELLALARQADAGGKHIDFASPGAGSTQHLSMELMNVMAGTTMTHIPYKGGAPALNDLLAGLVPIMFLTTVQSLPFLETHRVKALAVSTRSRAAVLPGVPTISEAGVPGYHSDVWFGIIAPAGTPASIINTLHTAIARIVQSPEMQKTLAAQGAEPIGNTPREFQALIDAEYEKWADVFNRTGITVQ